MKETLILILVSLGMIVGGIFGLITDVSQYDVLFLGMRFDATIPTFLGSLMMIAIGGYLLYFLLKDIFKKK